MFKLLAILAVCCIQAAFSSNVCPCDWNKIGNKCYKFFTTKVKWDTARASCQKRGGDLAIISNLYESNLLATQADVPSWIGYFRPRYQPNKFVSVCGLTQIFQNWASGEPNDYKGRPESCVELLTLGSHLGKWNDATCTSLRAYICEFNYLRCN